jgi:hypothetical protein
MCFFSRALLAMAVDLDVPEGLSDDLQSALLAPFAGSSIETAHP